MQEVFGSKEQIEKIMHDKHENGKKPFIYIAFLPYYHFNL